MGRIPPAQKDITKDKWFTRIAVILLILVAIIVWINK